MGKLEDQLAKAEQQAARERKPEKPKGGPVEGEHGDRWIPYHATLTARSATVMTVAITLMFVLSLATFAVVASKWKLLALVCGLGTVPIGIAFANLGFKRSRAVATQRAFVEALPFAFPDYVETMRSPRWWTAYNHFVRYTPTLVVAWKAKPDPETVKKLCMLVKAKVLFDDKNPLRATIEHLGSSNDPWRWTRAVVHEVLLPLQEQTQVESIGLAIKREVEEATGD